MIHKTGTNLRNDEILRILPLEQIPTFGDLDKMNIMTNRWKRNKFTWHLLQQGIDLRETFWKSHVLGAELSWFFPSLHMSICQKASISLWKLLKKHLLNFVFLVSPNVKRFYSHLGTSVGPSQMKILLTSYYQNISFRKTVLSQKFQASFFLLIISCLNFAIRNKLQKSSEI